MLMRILFSKRYKHEEGWFAEGKAATMAEDYRRTGETEASAGKAVSEVREDIVFAEGKLGKWITFEM